MKTRFLAQLLLLLCSAQVWAQGTITGQVVDEQQVPLPGVNVIVAGTSQGVVTDFDGNYSIEAPNNATLVFSFLGFAEQSIPVNGQSEINATMREDVSQLDEVVVTALGIQREKKALQYSVTEVGGEKFTEARENNVGNALVGRVAGVNVSKPSSGPAGSTRIVIRGNKSIGSEGQPLYVIDGIPMDNSGFGQAGLWGGGDQGDGLTSINPDDIESMSILKGANASALYGSRGGNGVVLITTKRGSKQKGVGVSYSSNFVFESLYDQSERQTKYGAGAFENNMANKPANARDAFQWENIGWGPALDGSMVVQSDGVLRPYSYAGDNFAKFFGTGISMTNSISMSGGGENQTFRFSVSDLRSTSIIPNSGYDRTNISISSNSKFGKKLTLDAKLLYSHEDAQNRPSLSDSPNNAIQTIWRIPANVDVNIYRGDPNKPGAIPEGTSDALLAIYGQGGDPKFPGQERLPAANNWGQNPYWTTENFIRSDIRDRVITSAALRYDFTDWLFVSARHGMDFYLRRDTGLTPEGTGHTINGNRTEGEDRIREINFDGMVGVEKSFGKFDLNAFAGYSRMRRTYERISANGNGFNVQFFPAIENVASRTFGYGFDERGINSVYGQMEVSYNSVLFLTGTARNDWFSVLNPDFNSIFYPSVGGSWIFSESFGSKPTWLSFGKLRASWAQTGIVTINPYATNNTYSLAADDHLGYTRASFSSAGGSAGNIPNPELQPALSTEIEAGIDIRLFQNRFGIDFTYYQQKTTDDILNATIPNSSGFGSTSVNVGEIQNKGFEFLITGTPIQGPLTWDISLNFAKNDNEVVKLIEGVTQLDGEEPRTRNVRIRHIEGLPYGTITGQIQKTDPSGNLIFDADGIPVPSDDYVPIGNGVPDFTGGVNNTFSYKGFSLDFLIDFKSGGEIFSGTNNRLTQWGFHQQTLLGRAGEAPLHITGVVNTGTDDVPNYVPVDRDLTPQEANTYWDRIGNESATIADKFIYDASFIKLRQLQLGYTFPQKFLDNTPIQNLSISLVGRNLWVIKKHIDNVDPESTYSTNAGAQGLEYFAMPATRSFGFNFKIGF